MDLRAYMAKHAPALEAALEAAVPPADAPPSELHTAMRHLLFPGGKRLRPALCLAAAEAVGSPAERALPFAAAVELVHTYSLIHDDLPCMDDDAVRRGRPSVHVRFGESTAVLAGDALQAAAFRTLLDAPAVPADRLLEAARDLADAAGSRALVGGQVDDLAFGPHEAARPDLATHVESVHARKTGALIAAAIVGGARLGGAKPDTLARLQRSGVCLGIAFQIADDLLDEQDDEGCSLVRALGPEAARARADALLATALVEIDTLGEPAEALNRLARYAVWRRE